MSKLNSNASTTVLQIDSVDLDGQGVGRIDGKVVFVQNALPGELVEISIVRRKKSYDKAVIKNILKESPLRVQPKCPHFGTCGGCVMQHIDSQAQVAIKQCVLESNLKHLGGVVPEQVLPAMYGPSWAYRYRAKLSVRYVSKKGGALVGFRERNSRFVADMSECHVLPKHVSDLLVPLRNLIGQLSGYNRTPQIEVAVGTGKTALVLRHLDPLTDADQQKLIEFAAKHGISWWLQPKGPETVHPLIKEDEGLLYYDLPQYDLRMQYKPTDFTQVNHFVNASLVARALNLLGPAEQDTVADMFCGLGNFSLPLARLAKHVIGIEGAKTLSLRAANLAEKHGLSNKTSFKTLNLFEIDKQWLLSLGFINKMLIDPPRDGAFALVNALSELDANERPERIVYVSCNPATLARDAGVLVNTGKYKLRSASVVNMFPHTGHVESIAVFE